MDKKCRLCKTNKLSYRDTIGYIYITYSYLNPLPSHRHTNKVNCVLYESIIDSRSILKSVT